MTFEQGLIESKAMVKSESLAAVSSQPRCIETNMLASNAVAQENAGNLVAMFWSQTQHRL